MLSIDEISDLSMVEQGVAKYLEKQLWEIWEDRGFCRLIFSYLLVEDFCSCKVSVTIALLTTQHPLMRLALLWNDWRALREGRIVPFKGMYLVR